MIPSRAKQTMCAEFQKLLIGFATELDTQAQASARTSVEQLRRCYREQVFAFNGPMDDVVETHDLSFSGRDGHSIKLRSFTPPSNVSPLPICFFIHGGGWVVGDLDTHTGICADIARQTGHKVIAVDYRLSPEAIFPKALNDCIDALRYIANNAKDLEIRSDQISLIGDSAGGNLCAALAMAYRGSDINIASQVLIYPSLGCDTSLPSFKENEDIPGLSRSDMAYYFQSYVGSSPTVNKLAAPLTATNFSDLPKCYVSVAEFDPLRDDGIEYARKLEGAGTPVVVSIENGLGHSWLWVRNRSEGAKIAMQGICDFLSR